MLESELWLRPGQDIAYELRQAEQEGKLLPYELKEQGKAMSLLPPGPDREAAARALYEAIRILPLRPGFPRIEPDELTAIQETLPEWTAPKRHCRNIDLSDRIYGGWLGRCAGCLLGQPVEGWMRGRIIGLLAETGNLPVRNYLSSDLPASLREKYGVDNGPGPYDALTKNWINLTDGMPEDDDTNYTIFSLRLLERKGRGFTSEDVAAGWLTSLPLLLTCSAERVAYRNFSMLIPPPESARYCNPYREWIGAQIRADLYGWINPDHPETAAAMAWRDARISHVKNGIYGAMFAAAMNAAAFLAPEPSHAVRAGLGQIPKRSRLAESINLVLDWHTQGVCAEDAVDRVHILWDESDFFDWCHVIPNAMLVTAALLYGNRDFTRTVGLAVSAGFDTDCNAATAGAVLGVMLGADALPSCWTEPLRDKIRSGVHGYPESAISELARRTADFAKWEGPRA